MGFEVEVPRSTLVALPDVGEETILFTHLHVREEELRLFGFATPEERRLFRMLIQIQKVGGRLALDVMSTLDMDTFRSAVLQGDTSVLTRVPGVGKKLADRILFELQGKEEQLPGTARIAVPPGVEPGLPMEPKYGEAVQGLVYLGTRLPAAQKAIHKAYEVLGPNAEVVELIREGLKHRR
jgi:Holliday junction DNA helicase RuvA